MAIETFGGGVHRIVVVKEGTNHVLGVLSQTRLVNFLWENGRSFPVIDQLYPVEIRNLGIGNQLPISINGDRPLKEALCLMNNEGISSLAVVDNLWNVVGNISNTDVKVCLPTAGQSCFLTKTYLEAPYQVQLRPSSREHLHPLHLRHPIHAWHERRQGLLPRLPRISILHSRPHRCEARCYTSAPNVGRRKSYSRLNSRPLSTKYTASSQRPNLLLLRFSLLFPPRLHLLDSFRPNLHRPPALPSSSSLHLSPTSQPPLPGPLIYSLRLSIRSARPAHVRPPQRRRQPDGYSKPVCTSERPAAQRSRGGAASEKRQQREQE